MFGTTLSMLQVKRCLVIHIDGPLSFTSIGLSCARALQTEVIDIEDFMRTQTTSKLESKYLEKDKDKSLKLRKRFFLISN